MIRRQTLGLQQTRTHHYQQQLLRRQLLQGHQKQHRGLSQLRMEHQCQCYQQQGGHGGLHHQEEAAAHPSLAVVGEQARPAFEATVVPHKLRLPHHNPPLLIPP